MDQTPATKYFIYARKSSEGDERQVQSIGSQLEELNMVIRNNKLKVVDKIDESKSAKVPYKRDGFERMLKGIEKGEANAILVWHPDRLSRNAIDAGRVIQLMDDGFLQEIRTPNQLFRNYSMEKMMLYFSFMNAKYENDKKGEDVKRGLKTKAERGWLPGRAVPIVNGPYLR